MEWIVDRNAVKGDLSRISGLDLSDNPIAYIKRKIFTLTGHAMLGYLGYNKGYTHIYQSAFDDGIFHTVFSALTECGKGWCTEYGMPPVDFYRYVTVMLRRFSDTRFKDPCARVCREPIRKLSKNERFLSPAAAALKLGVAPENIIMGICTVLKYDNDKDEQSVELQRMIKHDGLSAVLEQVCQLDSGSELFRMIREAY
jgi:mannitol-1-phosphate 5-dehydrogenase